MHSYRFVSAQSNSTLLFMAVRRIQRSNEFQFLVFFFEFFLYSGDDALPLLLMMMMMGHKIAARTNKTFVKDTATIWQFAVGSECFCCQSGDDEFKQELCVDLFQKYQKNTKKKTELQNESRRSVNFLPQAYN